MYKADDYGVHIWWSEEDKVFVAQVIDMPGIMAHGDTREQAAHEIQVALEFALAVYYEEDRMPPAPMKHSLLA